MSVRAVYFDGKTYLTRTTIPGMPTSQVAGAPASFTNAMFSFWYQTPTHQHPFVFEYITELSQSITDIGSIDFGLEAGELDIVLPSSVNGGDGYLDVVTAGNPPGADLPGDGDGQWHNLIIAVDLTVPTCVMYLDNSPIDLYIIAGPPFAMPLNYPNGLWSFGADNPYNYTNGRSVNQDGTLAGVWQGSMAEVYMNFTTFDFIGWLSNPTNRANFINSDGTAVSLGGTGYQPLGVNYPPQVYMSGPSWSFPLDPTVHVSLGINTYRNAWQVQGGASTLKNATSDPFIAGTV